MTNQLALLLGAALALALGVDWQVYDWANSLFLARKLVDLIEWIAFWR